MWPSSRQQFITQGFRNKLARNKLSAIRDEIPESSTQFHLPPLTTFTSLSSELLRIFSHFIHSNLNRQPQISFYTKLCKSTTINSLNRSIELPTKSKNLSCCCCPPRTNLWSRSPRCPLLKIVLSTRLLSTQLFTTAAEPDAGF